MAKRQRKTRRQSKGVTGGGSLRPVPPVILQKIKWLRLYGLKHWKYSLVALVVLLLAGIGPCLGVKILQKPSSEDLDRRETSRPSSSDTNQPSDRILPALQVVFRDGAHGYVNMTIRIQLIAEKAPWVLQQFGSQKNVEKQLIGKVEGHLLAELEKHSITEARQRRLEIAAQVVADLKEVVTRDFGYILHGIDLRQIE